jgi:DNA-binding HxlR family transcriptional regulator
LAITALPPDTDADIARVTEALAMITPRWNVRILLALSGPPLRYTELAAKVSWLQNGQLHPKLKALCDAGLVERTEHSARHVTYGHTERGVALLPVLPMIVTWAEEHLEKADRPLPAIEQIEDSLTRRGHPVGPQVPPGGQRAGPGPDRDAQQRLDQRVPAAATARR